MPKMSGNKLPTGFGERLREERRRLGLSQAKFAEQVGIQRVTQHFYEKEHNPPNYKYFKEISELGVDLVYLFFNKKKDPSAMELSLDTLANIFTAVEESGKDAKGNPYPFEEKLDLFRLLCVSVSGRTEGSYDMDNVVSLLVQQRKQA